MIKWFRDKLGPGSFPYSILQPCTRCVYGKRKEPIIILSGKTLQVKVIVNYKGSTYIRRGKCIGIASCQDCFSVIDGDLKKDCRFIKIRTDRRLSS